MLAEDAVHDQHQHYIHCAGQNIHRNDLSLIPRRFRRRGDSDDIVDTDHISDRAACHLQGDYRSGREAQDLRCLEFQRSEHDAGHRAGAGDEGAEDAQRRNDEGIIF